ncbi:hypothetical protein MED01_007042 [Micromonospora sp. MED01]|uniref:DUF6907 domain-containing protein n=1 Tax=Micromonospora alfalfae TaxID=2911212 RepID=UPI001EE8E33F|nr:hypothetical protein [Micromonospora alfalfae]MCG5462164.1 hypothetical protein [Micromonospora alfalfae]
MKILASASVPSENRLNDADTTNLTAIQRPADIRFPMNAPYTGAADDLALVQEAIRANPAAVHELAEAIRREDGETFKNGYVEGYADGLQRALAARPADCPPFCTEDHRGQITEHDGFSIGLCHEVVVTDLTADEPSSTTGTATARVLVESTTERGEVTTPTRVVLTLVEGDTGHYAGGDGVQGWSGTPAEVEQLAHALLSAARIARHA